MSNIDPSTYDPKDYTVDEVRDFLKANPAEAQRIYDAEVAEGAKDRQGVKDAAVEAGATIVDVDDPNADPDGPALDENGNPIDGSQPPQPPVDGNLAVGSPNALDPANPPEGYVEGRAATAQPTGNPAHDAPPYSENANPPETRADYASVETSSDQETTLEGGDPNASDA